MGNYPELGRVTAAKIPGYRLVEMPGVGVTPRGGGDLEEDRDAIRAVPVGNGRLGKTFFVQVLYILHFKSLLCLFNQTSQELSITGGGSL